MSSLSAVTKDQGELIVTATAGLRRLPSGDQDKILSEFLWFQPREVISYLLGPEHWGRGVAPGHAVKLGDAIETDPGGRGADNEHRLSWKYKHFYN